MKRGVVSLLGSLHGQLVSHTILSLKHLVLTSLLHQVTWGSSLISFPQIPPISITTLSIHAAKDVFPKPFVFDPERWLGEAGRGRRKFQMAFSKGDRKCLGIELASAERYLFIAMLVRRFEMELWETDDSDVAFLHDYQVEMPKLDSKGVRFLVKAR